MKIYNCSFVLIHGGDDGGGGYLLSYLLTFWLMMHSRQGVTGKGVAGTDKDIIHHMKSLPGERLAYLGA